jgi:hypothetical protein
MVIFLLLVQSLLGLMSLSRIHADTLDEPKRGGPCALPTSPRFGHTSHPVFVGQASGVEYVRPCI